MNDLKESVTLFFISEPLDVITYRTMICQMKTNKLFLIKWSLIMEKKEMKNFEALMYHYQIVQNITHNHFHFANFIVSMTEHFHQIIH